MTLSPTGLQGSLVLDAEALYHELSMAHPEIGASVLCPGWVRTRIHEAGRNRPERHGGPTPLGAGEEGGPSEVMAGLIESGIDPAEVAEMVFSAMVERRFWVFTGDEWTDLAAERARRAFSGENPQFRIPGVELPG